MGSAVANAEVGFRVNFAWLAGTLLGLSTSAFAGDFLVDLGVVLFGVVLVGVLDLEGEAASSLDSSTALTSAAAAAFLAEALGVDEMLVPFFKGDGVLMPPVARACARVMRLGVDAGLLLPEADAFFGVDLGVVGMI